MAEVIKKYEITKDYIKKAWSQFGIHAGVPQVLSIKTKTDPSVPRVTFEDKTLDWWPIHEIDARVDVLQRCGIWQWDTAEGPLHTASLIENVRWSGAPDFLSIAVCLGAGLKTILGGSRRGIRPDWHGCPVMMADDLEGALRAIFLKEGGYGWWHHASTTALPGHLPCCFYEKFIPETMGDLIFAARLLFEVSIARWAVVEVSEFKDLAPAEPLE